MQHKEKRLLAYYIAMDQLIKGEKINKLGLEALDYYLNPDFFEKNIKERIEISGNKDVTTKMVFDKLTESLIDINDLDAIVYYAQRINQLDFNRLAKVVCYSRRVDIIKEFAKIEGAPVEQLTEAALVYGTIKNIWDFIRVIDVPKELLEETLIKKYSKSEGLGDEEIKNLLNYVENISYGLVDNRNIVGKFEKTIIASKNAELIYEFGLRMRDANLDNLMDALIKINAESYIVSFIRDINRIDVSHIEKAKTALINMEAKYSMFRLADLEKCPRDIAEELIETAITM